MSFLLSIFSYVQQAPSDGQEAGERDFRGIKLSNETHCYGTDPVDALFYEGVVLLCRKSKVHIALPSHRPHALMDNRHALIVDCRLTEVTGTGERHAAAVMAADHPGTHQKTIGADKNYETKGFVAELRRIGVTSHVAQNTARSSGSAKYGRTTSTEGHAQSINSR